MSVQSDTTKVIQEITVLNQAISLNGFYFQLDSQVLVVSLSTDGVPTVRNLTTDYTLTGAGVATYGTMTVVGGTIGDVWYIYRGVPITQQIGWVQAGGFSTTNAENMGDKGALIDLQLQELLDRVLKYPVTEAVTTLSELPVASVRANGFLFFDALGNPSVSPLASSRTSIVLVTEHVATAGQTAFACSAHDVGLNNVSVYVNGSRLLQTDFVETSTVLVTLDTGVEVDDEVSIIVNETQFVPPPIKTLANEATPTVENGETLLTGGTTAITDFDDGLVGQTIRIKAKHSITITDGTPIELNGGSNFAMVTGDTLTLTMYESGVWSEDARSVN